MCNNRRFIVGDTVKCTCSSDLETTSISWFEGDQDTTFACRLSIVTVPLFHYMVGARL